MASTPKNKLYFGDNLTMLREHVKDESVDLIYLDPPFNSNANYNVLFGDKGGASSEAQAEAFRDTWGWGEAASLAYHEIEKGGGETSVLLNALRTWLGESGMMAYLAMMTVRLQEMHRTLSHKGSLFLHCDPTASHYLKLILDSIFGHDCFRNEVVWKRKAGRGETNNAAVRFSVSHDVILFYARSSDSTFQPSRGTRGRHPSQIELSDLSHRARLQSRYSHLCLYRRLFSIHRFERQAATRPTTGAGFVSKSAHGKLLRIQIATIGDLLDRRFPKLPPLPQPVEMMPRSRAARDRDQLEMLLPISGHGVLTDAGAFRDPRFMKVG